MTTPFIDETDLAAYLHVDDLDNDDLATIAIDAACEVVRGWLDQEVNQNTGDTVVLDGNPSDVLLLPELPVTAVTTVKVDYDTDNPTTLVAGADDDYVLGDGGMLYRIDGGNWDYGRQSIQVTYTHGWSSVPTDIKMVALQVAARIYDAGHAVRESVGSYNVEYIPGAAGLNDYEKAVLRKYRRVA